MKPLVTAKRMLTWLSVFPIDKNVSITKRLGYMSFTAIILTCLLSAMISSSVFFVKYISIDLQQSLYAVLHLTLVVQALYMYAVIYRMRNKTKLAFEHLTNIYDQCKSSIRTLMESMLMITFHLNLDKADENSFRFLAQADEVSEWMWPIYWKFSLFGFFIGIPFTIAIPILILYLRYGIFDMEHVVHPFGLA